MWFLLFPGTLVHVVVEDVGPCAVSGARNVVVCSISKIVCFTGITFAVAERTHLVIYYVFTVTCNLTLYFPFSSICGEKRSALLEIDFAYFAIRSPA